MSSLLQTLQALNSPRGMPGMTADNGLAAQNKSGQEGQAFSSLMNQFRDGQGAASAQPKAAVATPAAANTASKEAASRATARATADRSAQNLAAQRQAAAQRDAAESRPAEKAKAPVKPAQAAKPQQPAKAKASEKTEAPEPDKVEATGKADDSKEVAFATEQGQASAWVKELQPPAEVSTSDPAAMLAWLSGLSKGDAPVGEALEAAGGSGSAEGKGPGGLAGLPGVDTAKAGGTPGWSVQAQQSEQGADLSKGSQDAQAGLTLEELGMTPVAEEPASQSSPLDFHSLMARETGRAAGVQGQGPEAARHYTGSLNTPVHSADFQQALADRVGMWISGPAASGPMTAELRLNPTEMGPVQIRIVLDGQTAQVDFAAAQAETRQAIEASLPALSAQLEEAGLSLSGGGVSDQNAGQSWRGDQAADRADGGGNGRSPAQAGVPNDRANEQGTAATQLAARAAAHSRPGGLDLYA
jgi:flagellar hook-length control protein FliK